jgi:ribulose kinase
MRAGLEVMRALGTAVDDVRATGGGARSSLWLQLQADEAVLVAAITCERAGADPPRLDEVLDRLRNRAATRR